VEIDDGQKQERRGEDHPDQRMSAEAEAHDACDRQQRTAVEDDESLNVRERGNVFPRREASRCLLRRRTCLLTAHLVALVCARRMSSVRVSMASHLSATWSAVFGLGRSSSETRRTETWGWSASIAATVRAASLSDSLASRTTTSSQ